MKTDGISMRIGCVAVPIILVMLGIILFSFTRTVDAGEVCVKTEFGKVGGIAEEGLHLVRPTQQFHCYSRRTVVYETSDHFTQTNADFGDARVDTQTSDGQQVDISYSLLWHIEPSDAEIVYKETGRSLIEVNERAVKAPSRSFVRNIITQYTAEELFSGTTDAEGNRINTRLEVQSVIQTALEEELGQHGVTLESFYLRAIDFDEDYVEAIEEKEIAEERVDTALQNADATRLTAQGEADSIRIVGEALREYPEVLQQDFINNADFAWGIMPFEGVQPFIPLEFPSNEPNEEVEPVFGE